jgi:hypothetical protein
MDGEHPHPGPWQLIATSGMLQWMQQPTAVFDAWRHELAPGGRVLGGLFAAGSLPEMGKLVSAPLIWRDEAEWRAHLEAAQLKVHRISVEQRVYHFPDALSLWRSLHGIGAAPRTLLGAGRMRTLLREYEARYNGPLGVYATWAFLRFEATAV